MEKRGNCSAAVLFHGTAPQTKDSQYYLCDGREGVEKQGSKKCELHFCFLMALVLRMFGSGCQNENRDEKGDVKYCKETREKRNNICNMNDIESCDCGFSNQGSKLNNQITMSRPMIVPPRHV